MSHINLSIQQGQNKARYILSNADYMGEAWLAKVNEDNTTKIIRLFRCSQFRDCFRDLKMFVDRLGEVKQLSASCVADGDRNLLENILLKNDGILPVNNSPNRDLNLFWDWFRNVGYIPSCINFNYSITKSC